MIFALAMLGFLPATYVQQELHSSAADYAHSRDTKCEQSTPCRSQNARQEKIVQMMRHAWNEGYAKHCWGKDELHPVSRACGSGWKMGLTLVDSLDTLYLMGMDAEFEAARNWVADRAALSFEDVGNVNLFETTIRVLGGLLGAHALSGDPVFLERARELGDRLLPGLRGYGNGVPFSDINLRTGHGQFLGSDASTAEATSLVLEFKTLSHLTGSAKYAEAVDNISRAVRGIPKAEGLVSIYLDPRRVSMHGPVSLGSRGDSYYEYLLKAWLLTGREEAASLSDYVEAMRGLQHRLVQRTSGPLRLTYVGELRGGRADGKMDHLVCFLPGCLALGAASGLGPGHLPLAEALARTCTEMYRASGLMLAPEIVHFDTGGEEVHIKPADAHCILRPETVESLFYLYRVTRNRTYQDEGWAIAEAIERHARVGSGGYSSLRSVLSHPPPQSDKMESFFLAETLKYLYLLFDDTMTQVPLDKFVFNTEAHPLRIFR